MKTADETLRIYDQFDDDHFGLSIPKDQCIAAMEEYASQSTGMTRERVIEVLSKYWNINEYNVTFDKIASSLAPEEKQNDFYLIIRDGNISRVFKNGQKMEPSEFVPIYGCELTDEQKKIFYEIQKQYFDILEAPEEKISDPDIEKWCKIHAVNCSSDLYHQALIKATTILALKAMRDGTISEWVKNNH